jgi:hypothetical protein
MRVIATSYNRFLQRTHSSLFLFASTKHKAQQPLGVPGARIRIAFRQFAAL